MVDGNNLAKWMLPGLYAPIAQPLDLVIVVRMREQVVCKIRNGKH